MCFREVLNLLKLYAEFCVYVGICIFLGRRAFLEGVTPINKEH